MGDVSKESQDIVEDLEASLHRRLLDDWKARIERRDTRIAVIGMGYVGLPLALTALGRGFSVQGFDIDPRRVAILNEGRSGFRHIADAPIAQALAEGRFQATTDPAELAHADAILIAVPTPLSRQREPDLSFVEASTRTIAELLRQGQLIVLESTTWPGTTREVMRPILESSGLRCGVDFFLAFSPEREDPGNAAFATGTIPKIVGADDPLSAGLARQLYDALVIETVPVSSAATAEAVKLTENIFRAVNIALVNELKVIFEKMGIDVWEVIDAAKTKPFGYMPFHPGPGLGGHCIPIDPFYLTWKAREFGIETRFIELAGQINTSMPGYVISRLAEVLDRRTGKGLNGAAVLVIGLSYKKNIEDTRESPSLKLIELLEHRGARVTYHDPYVRRIPRTREYPHLEGRESLALDPATIAAFDAVLIATDHDAIAWPLVADHARLIVDTRNAMERHGFTGDHIVKA